MKGYDRCVKKDQSAQATKKNNVLLWKEMRTGFASVATEFGNVRKEMATKRDMQRMEDLRKKDKEEVKHHFDFVIENLRHDLLGAGHDEIEVLKDARKDHEHRIKRLETHAGIVA